MAKIIENLADKTIQYSFYLLFFLVPLILTPFNYELFEYNKMIVTYGLTSLIVGAWTVKMIAYRGIRLTRTPLDLPIFLFLASQIISTVFSLDRHVSVWGYYSRFNGGLLSIFSYILLYYALVTNFPQKKIFNLLSIIIISAILVAVYGIMEHFGIDRDLWVQDVQNRVFSSLGQPNWLAAYLSVLIPITIGIGLTKFSNQISDFNSNVQNSKFPSIRAQNKCKAQNQNVKSNYIGLLGYWVIASIFYITLLFTKSRSGFLGLWISLGIIWLSSLIFTFLRQYLSRKITQDSAAANICIIYNKLIGFIVLSLVVITFIIGSPFPYLNRLTLLELTKSNNHPAVSPISKPSGDSIIDVGITESGTIRRIVWKGALDIFQHNPLFGTGVETFAFAYYKYRPIEHNMTSEWDFLYNKAHNEYLNYAATTGLFGLGSYLLIIVVFVIWIFLTIISKSQAPNHNNQINLKHQISNNKNQAGYANSEFRYWNLFGNCNLNIGILILCLFAGWLSILITNFFGFSVVIIQLFFFLIPAIVFVLSDNTTYKSFFLSASQAPKPKTSNLQQATVNPVQYLFIIVCCLSVGYVLTTLIRLWLADTTYAKGYHYSRSQEYTLAYPSLKQAIVLNDREPLYFDEFSFPAAQMAAALYNEKQSTVAAQLEKEAISTSTLAITLSPNNVNFWKTRTRVFYALSQIDEKYLANAFDALLQAKILSPSDPKVRYNLALLYDKFDKKNEAIAELSETIRLKPDYRDAYYALAFFYQREKKKDEAKEALNYILTHIATDDAEVKKKLEELK